MSKKFCHEKIIDEILELFKDNLILLYNFNDSSLPNIRNYCKIYERKRYKILPYDLLINFAYETLNELLECKHLYDFRDID